MSRIAIMGAVCVLLVGAGACSARSAPTSAPPPDGPKLVQETAASATGATVVVTLPRAVRSQNLLVAAVSWTGDGELAVDGAAPSWAATSPSESVGSTRGQLVYAVSDASGGPVRVTAPGSSALRVDLREYSGVDAGAPLLAGSASATPPTPDRRGTGLQVSAVATAGQPATIRDQVVMLSRRLDPINPTDASESVAFTALFRAGPSAPTTRDPMRQPFSSASIWNTAIGSAARFTPADLPAVPGGDRYAPMPQNDQTSIIETPDAPLTDVRFSDAGWTGKSRCTATRPPEYLAPGPVYVWYRVPMPAGYVVPGSLENEGASWLMPDRRTINQGGPLARCLPGGYATSLDTSLPLDLYGDGLSRSLGGSGLSGIVGVLRRGELRPDSDGTGVRHALRVNIDTTRQLARCDTDSACYRWPASSADNDAVSSYGRLSDGVPPAMRLGALLAIAPTVDLGSLGLRTAPARQIAWTLQNYGAYVADSTACACFAIVTEKGPDGDFASQFADDYGFDFAQRVDDGTPWTQDMQKLQTVLSVVDNNSPDSIGGGGLPRQPAAPQIAP